MKPKETLRNILRVPAINHAVRRVGKIFIPGQRGRDFVRKLPLVDNFDIALPNGRVIHWSPQKDGCSKFLKYHGWDGYETQSVRLFAELARHAEVVFDVGAYVGYFAFLAAASGEHVQAYAFEAMPELAAHSRKIAALNPHLNVQIINAAVAEKSGHLTMYVDDPWTSDTSASPAHRPNRRPVTVQAVALDDFMRNNGIGRVDLLKIDTETTEAAVLRGMQAALVRHRPYIIAEVLPESEPRLLADFQAKNGYACAWIHPTGLLPAPNPVPDPTLANMNWLFYPSELPGPMGEVVRRHLGDPA